MEMVGETTVLAALIVIRARLVVTVMIVLVGLTVMLLVERRAVLIVIRVHRVEIVMIVLAGLTVMLLAPRRVVIVKTDHVRLIVTHAFRVAIVLSLIHISEPTRPY